MQPDDRRRRRTSSKNRLGVNGIGLALVVAVAAISIACSAGAGASATVPSAGNATPTASSKQAIGATVTDPGRLCDLLGPGDFDAVGISGASAPEINSEAPGSAYCTYAGASGARGGIELDAFVDEDPVGVFRTIVGEGATHLIALEVAGADEARGMDGTAGKPDDPGQLIVRSGRLVFTIAAPGDDGVSAQLASLAALVVSRGSSLAR
jgi:hypothetical protein